jgi:hypothetical protein
MVLVFICIAVEIYNYWYRADIYALFYVCTVVLGLVFSFRSVLLMQFVGAASSVARRRWTTLPHVLIRFFFFCFFLKTLLEDNMYQNLTTINYK